MNINVLNPMFLTDFYKTLHHVIYVDKLDFLTSYWTPRKVIWERQNVLPNEVVVFGLQAFIKEWLIDYFNEAFFKRDVNEIVEEYETFLANTFNEEIGKESQIIRDLHKLGYMPLSIRALPEGTIVPTKVPMIEITNTVKGFAWLVNYLETLFSCNMWLPSCAASIARIFRLNANKAWEDTCDSGSPRTFCCDFAMRGMGSMDAAMKSAAGHMLSFTGASTIPSYYWLEKYYNADSTNGKIAKCSPSTEHSVMSSYGPDKEVECYRTIIDKVKNGPLSIVSDTYDYWNLITNVLVQLKDQIMNRNGKVLIRGDSGDPVDIICGWDIPVCKDMNAFDRLVIESKHGLHLPTNNGSGKLFREREYVRISGNYYTYKFGEKLIPVDLKDVPPEVKGTVECLWEIFGGTINSKGYKVLDSHIGALYGDGITIARANIIWERLRDKMFAASNVGLGVGSYTYQYNTRDTYGFALKATHAIVDGKPILIYKDPKTDKDTLKKSHKGLCKVVLDNEGKPKCIDGFLERDDNYYKDNLMIDVFKDGKLLKETSLDEIRNTLWNNEF